MGMSRVKITYTQSMERKVIVDLVILLPLIDIIKETAVKTQLGLVKLGEKPQKRIGRGTLFGML
jgi:hypothetical protein